MNRPRNDTNKNQPPSISGGDIDDTTDRSNLSFFPEDFVPGKYVYLNARSAAGARVWMNDHCFAFVSQRAPSRSKMEVLLLLIEFFHFSCLNFAFVLFAFASICCACLFHSHSRHLSWDVICQRGRENFDHGKLFASLLFHRHCHSFEIAIVSNNSSFFFCAVGNRRFRLCM